MDEAEEREREARRKREEEEAARKRAEEEERKMKEELQKAGENLRNQAKAEFKKQAEAARLAREQEEVDREVAARLAAEKAAMEAEMARKKKEMEDALKAQQAKIDADLQAQVAAANAKMAKDMEDQMAKQNASMADAQRRAQEELDAERKRLADKEAADLRAEAEMNRTKAGLDAAKAEFDREAQEKKDKLAREEADARKKVRQQALMSCQCKAFGHCVVGFVPSSAVPTTAAPASFNLADVERAPAMQIPIGGTTFPMMSSTQAQTTTPTMQTIGPMSFSMPLSVTTTPTPEFFHALVPSPKSMIPNAAFAAPLPSMYTASGMVTQTFPSPSVPGSTSMPPLPSMNQAPPLITEVVQAPMASVSAFMAPVAPTREAPAMVTPAAPAPAIPGSTFMAPLPSMTVPAIMQTVPSTIMHTATTNYRGNVLSPNSKQGATARWLRLHQSALQRGAGHLQHEVRTVHLSSSIESDPVAEASQYAEFDRPLKCTWSETAPFSNIALEGSCRNPVDITANFDFDAFNKLCTDQNAAEYDQGLELVLSLAEAAEDKEGESGDPAKEALERMKKEQEIGDSADAMVKKTLGEMDDESSAEPIVQKGPFQPQKTLFLPKVVDYGQSFTFRLRISGQRTREEMERQRLKFVREDMSCDSPQPEEITGFYASQGPDSIKVKEGEVSWVGIEFSGRGEAEVFDVCFCPSLTGQSDCSLPGRFFRLKGKFIAGEDSASPCRAWGYEVTGFKKLPTLKYDHVSHQYNIMRCVFDKRMRNADHVSKHCQKIMAFFPHGWDMVHWGSDKSCANHGKSLVRAIKQ
eukprot:gnl/MRDRNA2_/MRDRNA2_102464_c0_seq1.p1 gnl/MRDRNA2_/MRDRNA2_102464_c0~~gnl/MRDRNA2_/MRDRNA2_102464_c0_seq1.p1  ORF type:complete len:951 (+),score=248.36 gnl/MRDRNA2_/MRDRNA2_102464_c0_seq1:428-2854(+)